MNSIIILASVIAYTTAALFITATLVEMLSK